jgi:uncharacterized protein (UPF0261 family)
MSVLEIVIVAVVGMTLLLSQAGPLFPKIGLTLFGVIAILNSLNGWLFNVKARAKT